MSPTSSGNGIRAPEARLPRQLRRRARVRAAFLAAVERALAPLVRLALRAEAERAAALRWLAARLPCLDSAPRDAVERGSFSSTFFTARETRGRRFGCRWPWPTSEAYLALFRVDFLAPLRGGGRSTPARRASD